MLYKRSIISSAFNKTCPVDTLSTQVELKTFWEGVLSGDLDDHRKGWAICGIFALVNTIFSAVLIWQHLRNYYKPAFQRYYVRIILMIPVYSIVSFLGYRFYKESTYFEIALDFYEAFVIASFFILLLNMLGESNRSKEILKNNGQKRKAMIPLCCIKYKTDGWYYLEVVKWCVMQYVVIEPALSIADVILQICGKYCSESWSLYFGNSWSTIIEFFSVTIATYILIQFFLTIRYDIKQFNPLWKFIAIKLIIFLSFYQTVILGILGYLNVIKATQYWTQANIEYGINSLCICVEMFFFCFLDWYAYSHKEFVNSHTARPRLSTAQAAIDAFNIFDLFKEVGYNLRWLWDGFVLRKPYTRTGDPRDDRFDIHNVKNGQRTEALAMGGDYELTEPLTPRRENVIITG